MASDEKEHHLEKVMLGRRRLHPRSSWRAIGCLTRSAVFRVVRWVAEVRSLPRPPASRESRRGRRSAGAIVRSTRSVQPVEACDRPGRSSRARQPRSSRLVDRFRARSRAGSRRRPCHRARGDRDECPERVKPSLRRPHACRRFSRRC